MRYILVEGVTDVAFIKYICFKNNITEKFDDFTKKKQKHLYKDLIIVDLGGQENLEAYLKLLKPNEEEIEKIAIIQDADNNFEKSSKKIKTAIENSNIDNNKIKIFLTPNNKDLGDLETLLLSTIKDNNIVKCFDNYKECLLNKDKIHPKALNKGQVYAYTMYSQQGENLHKPQNSFMYKYDNKYVDTELWNLEEDEFKEIIDFILKIFHKMAEKVE